ncbi:MAG TPA: transposase [Phycisphaerae bacterium]|nr:transposase [Phycisphaerae bacterium]
MVDAIAQARERHRFDLWAYVIMPEHVHLLIYPTEEDYSISRILSSLKQPVSKRAILYVRRHAPGFLAQMTDTQPSGKTSLRFWQRGGGYDRNLWSPRYVWETIEYIHSNPVRRGLCDSETDWPWSSAGVFFGASHAPLALDLQSLPDDRRGR